MIYDYVIEGGAADDQTWHTQGQVEVAKLGDFPSVPTTAMAEAFGKLTRGKAIFGKPGVGCKGPYTITRMLIEART